MKSIILKESRLYVLTENKARKNMNLGKNYLMQNGGMTQDQALQVIGGIKHDMPNSRLADQKFMLGLCRMYLNRELDSDTVLKVNQMLKYVASDAHINEYDSNLNNLSANDIIERFTTIRNSSIEQEKNDLNNASYDNSNNSEYTIYRIETPEEAQDPKFADYTDWCVTYDEDMYDNYTNGEEGIFYFCLKNGYENVEKVKGENHPLDEYGLSMIAVSVDADGAPNTITCRWNHDGGNDNIMTPQQVSQLIGKSFYQAFPPRLNEEERKARFSKEVDFFIAVIKWYDETSYEGRYDEYGEVIEDTNGTIEFVWEGSYDNYNVEMTEFANNARLVMIEGRNTNYCKLMIFNGYKPLLNKFYASSDRIGSSNLVLLYPTVNYGNGVIFDTLENKILYEGVYYAKALIYSPPYYKQINFDNGRIIIINGNNDIVFEFSEKEGKIRDFISGILYIRTKNNGCLFYDLSSKSYVFNQEMKEYEKFKYHITFGDYTIFYEPSMSRNMFNVKNNTTRRFETVPLHKINEYLNERL